MARTTKVRINNNVVIAREAFASRIQSTGDCLGIYYDVDTGRIHSAFIDRWIVSRGKRVYKRLMGRVEGHQFIYSANGYDELRISVVLP